MAYKDQYVQRTLAPQSHASFDDALKAVSAAADAEDRTEKHPVTPGVPTPARELYGQMLLDRGMAKEALAAFEATLKKEPHRFGATIGAARAAKNSGDAAKARHTTRLLWPRAGFRSRAS
jgi:hypothetical protein